MNPECCTLFHGMSGEIAAVPTAMFFAMGSTFFTLAGRRVGASRSCHAPFLALS